jgi:hypothetical protein
LQFANKRGHFARLHEAFPLENSKNNAFRAWQFSSYCDFGHNWPISVEASTLLPTGPVIGPNHHLASVHKLGRGFFLKTGSFDISSISPILFNHNEPHFRQGKLKKTGTGRLGVSEAAGMPSAARKIWLHLRRTLANWRDKPYPKQLNFRDVCRSRFKIGAVIHRNSPLPRVKAHPIRIKNSIVYSKTPTLMSQCTRINPIG